VAGVASLTEKQLEHLLQAMPPQERKALGEWCRAQCSLPLRPVYHAPQDQYDGQPHTWFVRTLDTGRHARFQWPRMQMHAVPAMVSEEHLFKLSGRVFQQCAVPMAGAPTQAHRLPLSYPRLTAPSGLTRALCWRPCHAVALSRYERCRTGHVLAVNCPMKCLLKFIELQNRMNEIDAAGEHESRMSATNASPAAADQDAVAKAVDAAGALEPGLQELYAKKFGKSIQDDIVDAAASAPDTVGKNAPAAPALSPASQADLAALSADLVRYWEEHAVTHGEEASGGGRELFRSDLPSSN
jgi:hypothetical protein